MLSKFVGSVDLNAAVVLVALFVPLLFGLGACGLAFIVKWRPRQELDHEFELDRARLESEALARNFDAQTNREYKMKQLEQNLITSHRAEG